MMSTMRDAENALFPVEVNMADYVGPTALWKIKGWASEFLRYNNVACESTYVYGEFEAERGGTGAHFGRGGLSHDPQFSSHR